MESGGNSPRTSLRRSRRSRTTSENTNSPAPASLPIPDNKNISEKLEELAENASIDSSIDDQTKSLIQTLGEQDLPDETNLHEIGVTGKRDHNL